MSWFAAVSSLAVAFATSAFTPWPVCVVGVGVAIVLRIFCLNFLSALRGRLVDADRFLSFVGTVLVSVASAPVASTPAALFASMVLTLALACNVVFCALNILVSGFLVSSIQIVSVVPTAALSASLMVPSFISAALVVALARVDKSATRVVFV